MHPYIKNPISSLFEVETKKRKKIVANIYHIDEKW